jgi:hypothetical protein
VQDGKYLNTSPFQLGGRSILDTFALGRGPGGKGNATARGFFARSRTKCRSATGRSSASRA